MLSMVGSACRWASPRKLRGMFIASLPCCQRLGVPQSHGRRVAFVIGT
jgi:hypothetical protein